MQMTMLHGIHKKLYGLPIRSRINYKILLFVHKSLEGDGPEYLSAMLYMPTPTT